MNNLMMFENNVVEVFEFNGKVLFNPYDVGKCLDLSNSAVKMAIKNMNSNQVIKLTNSKVNSIDFRKLHNTGENFLTESGVYKLIFKSRKKEAERFCDWVTDEVLPTIRETGKYETNQPKTLPLTEKTYRGERVLFIKDIAGIYGVSRYSLSAIASVNGIGKLLKGRELKKFKAENKDVDLFLVSNIKIINRNEFSILKRCVSFCCDNDLINDYYAADGVKDEMSLYDKFRLVDLAGDILNVARRKAGNTDYYKALNLIASKIYVDCGMLDKHSDDLSINSKVGWNLQQPLIDMRALVRSRLTK